MIRGTTKIVGVMGYPVKHSASPPMHNAAFAALGLDWAYVPFTVFPSAETVAVAVESIRALDLRGVSVTVPLKEFVPLCLDELTARARRLGVVNTIVNHGDQLIGDSTDGPGFLQALEHAGLKPNRTTRAVVLGAGGAGRAITEALSSVGATVTVANRTPERAAALIDDLGLRGELTTIALEPDALTAALSEASLLVNTTSVGLHPHIHAMPPVPSDALRPGLFVADLIYNPRETRLLQTARERGCTTQNGVEMLVRQGALAFELWTQQAAPLDIMRDAVEAALG